MIKELLIGDAIKFFLIIPRHDVPYLITNRLIKTPTTIISGWRVDIYAARMTCASIIFSSCYQCRGNAVSLRRRIDSQALNLCKAIPLVILDKNETNWELLQISHKDGRLIALGKVFSRLLKCEDIVLIPADALQDTSDMNMIVWLKWPDLGLCSFLQGLAS